MNDLSSIQFPLVELRQVHKFYTLGETRIEALKGIDLTIQHGEFVAVWGPSGSGKSTLCNMIGLIDTPTSGTVCLKGVDIEQLSENRRSEARSRAIGFIFQGFNLIPVLSALENVMLPLQIRGDNFPASREKALRYLAELGLKEHASHRPAKLSGGQQQRVAIARALITEPALIVADEPTANLDSDNAVRIIELMRQINRTHGTTFLFSTHDERLLDRVNRKILMRDGRVVEDSATEKSLPQKGRSA